LRNNHGKELLNGSLWDLWQAARAKDNLEPACAKSCPTDSIQFGEVPLLLERARSGRAICLLAGLLLAFPFSVRPRFASASAMAEKFRTGASPGYAERVLRALAVPLLPRLISHTTPEIPKATSGISNTAQGSKPRASCGK
jgi:hypothetical protein